MSQTPPFSPTDPPAAPPGAAGAAPQPAPERPTDTKESLTRFWDWLRGLGITRSRERWIGGVAGGIAERYHLDPLLVRGLFVVAAMLGGVGFIAYGLAWALLPEPDGRIHAEELLRGRFDQADIGIGLFILVGLDPFDAGISTTWMWGLGKGIGWIVLIGLGLWLWSQHRAPGSSSSSSSSTTTTSAPAAEADGAAPWGSPVSLPAEQEPSSFGSPTPPQPGVYDAGHEPAPAPGAVAVKPAKPPKPNTAPNKGYVAAVIGVTGLVIAGLLIADRTGTFEASALVILAAALGVLGLGIVFAGLAGRRGGLLSLLAIIALVLVPGTANREIGWNVDFSGLTIAGSADWTPTTAAEAEEGLRLVAGRAVVDLTQVPLPAPGTPPVTVPVQITAGNAVITVPQGAPVLLDVEAFAGTATWDVGGVRGQNNDGVRTQQNVHVGPAGDPRLVLELVLGAGEASIEGAP